MQEARNETTSAIDNDRRNDQHRQQPFQKIAITLEGKRTASNQKGDRMNTDIISGIEAGLETILVLTGLTTREQAEREPYRASRVLDSIADLLPELE